MPQHNMESSRSQWQQGLRSPWITRVTEGQSPASSGAESDTESSSTESEKVIEWDKAVDDEDLSCQMLGWWNMKSSTVAPACKKKEVSVACSLTDDSSHFSRLNSLLL